MEKSSLASLFDRWINWIAYQWKMLPHRMRLWWHRAWIRHDEFDQSLNMDIRALAVMNKDDQKKYSLDLIRRRNIAHERDLSQ